MAKYGCCPFQHQLSNFVSFGGKSKLLNSRMIAMSIVFVMIMMTLIVNEYSKFGKIRNEK